MTLLFDYDGTLHNTIKLYRNAFQKGYDWLVENGHAPAKIFEDRELYPWLGISPPDMWGLFMPHLPEEIATHASRIIGASMDTETLSGHTELYSHVPEVLDQLAADGHTMLIVSNARTNYIQAHRTTFDLDRWFADIYCAEDYDYIPKEDFMRFAIEEYPDTHYVMIGDRDKDIEAAKANNVPIIGCAYGFAEPGELDPCDAIAQSPLELPELIARFM